MFLHFLLTMRVFCVSIFLKEVIPTEGIGERIRLIRKRSGLTQAEFGTMIKIASNTITCYEKGVRVPSDTVIELISTKFGANEEWLRTGEGDPFGPIDRAKTVAKIVNRAMARSPESDRQKIISMATSADDAHIVLLAQVLEEMFGPLPE